MGRVSANRERLQVNDAEAKKEEEGSWQKERDNRAKCKVAASYIIVYVPRTTSHDNSRDNLNQQMITHPDNRLRTANGVNRTAV